MKMGIKNLHIKFLMSLVGLWMLAVPYSFGQTMISVNRKALQAQRKTAKAKQSKTNKTYNARRSKASKSRARKLRTRRTYHNHYRQPETYLYVNGSLNPTISVPAGGGTINLSISMNAKSVSVNNLSTSYMKLTYVSTSFVQIQFDPNTSHSSYNDWFDICAGNKTVRVNVVRQGKPYDNVQAYFHTTTISENDWDIIIKGSLQISGAAQAACTVIALITDPNGQPYKYKGNEGNAVTTTTFMPEFDEARTQSFYLIIPKSTILFPKKKNYVMAKLYLYCSATQQYIVNATQATPCIKVKQAKRR